MSDRLTPKQKLILNDLERLREIVGIDGENIKSAPRALRTSILSNMRDQVIRSAIITDYTLVCELLDTLIASYFLEQYPKKGREKRFHLFYGHIAESLYLIHKIELYKDIADVPKQVVDMIYKLNDIRNAVAHSFLPSSRRKNRPVYKGEDVLTVEGIQSFIVDLNVVFDYLHKQLDH